MKLIDFYNKAISIAIDNDPRGKDFVLKELENRKKDFDKLSEKEKLYFDETTLTNPYSDSKIVYGEGNEEINTILAGIDIETGEVVLAEMLRQKGINVDLLLAHHPSGRALASLYAVINMQADILSLYGVPINVAESLLDARSREVERKILPANLMQTADAARLLKIPLICLHTAGDNMVATYLQNIFDNKKPHTLDDIIDILLEIEEYKEASKVNNGPKIMIGNKKRKSGKIFVDMTGGTSGSKDIYENLKSSGINTIVGMHINEDHRKEAEKNHINVVIAGHIASDNLGINLLLDKIIEDEPINVMECSGFRRYKR